jgi:hypothetical protein
VYNIGDKVWYASVEHFEKYMTCPDCLGHKFLRVIFGDGTECSIDCAGCSAGYEPPRGVVEYYGYEICVREVTIGGMEVQKDKPITYKFDCRTCSCSLAEEDRLSITKEDAEATAKILAAKMSQDAIDRIERKEKDTRTWAWNATYHRGKIKAAERDIAYHTDKLNAALRHKKEEVRKADK